MHGRCRSAPSGHTILIDFIDTQAQWSPWLDNVNLRGDEWMAGRKRIRRVLRDAHKLWPLFDTLATSGMAEILGLDRDSIVASIRDDAEAPLRGMVWDAHM